MRIRAIFARIALQHTNKLSCFHNVRAIRANRLNLRFEIYSAPKCDSQERGSVREPWDDSCETSDARESPLCKSSCANRATYVEKLHYEGSPVTEAKVWSLSVPCCLREYLPLVLQVLAMSEIGGHNWDLRTLNEQLPTSRERTSMTGTSRLTDACSLHEGAGSPMSHEKICSMHSYAFSLIFLIDSGASKPRLMWSVSSRCSFQPP